MFSSSSKAAKNSLLSALVMSLLLYSTATKRFRTAFTTFNTSLQTRDVATLAGWATSRRNISPNGSHAIFTGPHANPLRLRKPHTNHFSTLENANTNTAAIDDNENDDATQSSDEEENPKAKKKSRKQRARNAKKSKPPTHRQGTRPQRRRDAIANI